MNQSKNLVWQVWALIGVVFILGGITGAAVTNLYHTRRADSNTAEPATGNGERRTARRERMKRELNLTDAQATQINAIVDEARPQFRTAFEGCTAFKDLRDQTTARIRALLTPEQQQKFDEIRAKREEERSKK